MSGQNFFIIKLKIQLSTGRFQAGLLVETSNNKTGDISLETIRDEIWGMLRKANEETVARGRVPKDMIVFANPDKPFPRSGKGSVQRGLPPDLYSDEINETYERKSLLEDGALEGLSSQDVEILTKIFRHWIGSQTGRQVPDMSDDLFDAGLGLDSLLVL
ncbi:hypothetical protein EV356DRAFT_519126 [Viridothelium virens]|uniref:Carrier domain-containing protein n=1 Tax=Viridothelium virens TaxID=1048519 RepID=A0A6A6GYX4_VIRVR|nr:hypothetical protein EV356DRAFT_519126 [Viridothelium virens]